MYQFFKRNLDIIAAVLALCLLSPFMLIIAICIKIDTNGSVFFKQNRRGKNGKVFKLIKFRTMIPNAEKVGTGLFNFKDDPRVTKVGRFLRKTSLDEIPQLINIIKGEMSLIGPRPPVEYELGDYETLNCQYKKRFQIKPGITGLAQVSGRNELPWDQKIVFDNQYVDALYGHKGFRTDVKIFFQTIVKVFKKSDIYENKSNENLDDTEAAALAEKEIIRLAHLPVDCVETDKEVQIVSAQQNEENFQEQTKD